MGSGKALKEKLQLSPAAATENLSYEKEHGRPSAPKSSSQQVAAAATEQPENGIEQVKVPRASLEFESSGQHAAVAAVRQQPESAEEHARTSGAAPASESSGQQAAAGCGQQPQSSRSTAEADAAEPEPAAAPVQAAMSKAKPACSIQQAAAVSGQQAPSQAAASEASPAGSGQQAAASSGRRFTQAQQGMAAALMVVLKRALREGKPWRLARLALSRGNPIARLFLMLMPGTTHTFWPYCLYCTGSGMRRPKHPPSLALMLGAAPGLIGLTAFAHQRLQVRAHWTTMRHKHGRGISLQHLADGQAYQLLGAFHQAAAEKLLRAIPCTFCQARYARCKGAASLSYSNPSPC